MSDYESRIGTLRKIETNNIEDTCKDICNNNPDCLKWCDNFTEYVRCDMSDKYIISAGNIFEVIQDEYLDDDDMFKMTDNGDGTYSYILRYYNGGCGFAEAIDIAFENMNDLK